VKSFDSADSLRGGIERGVTELGKVGREFLKVGIDA
jgi:hypothetical protein